MRRPARHGLPAGRRPRRRAAASRRSPACKARGTKRRARSFREHRCLATHSTGKDHRAMPASDAEPRCAGGAASEHGRAPSQSVERRSGDATRRRPWSGSAARRRDDRAASGPRRDRPATIPAMTIFVHAQIHGLAGRGAELREVLVEHATVTAAMEGSLGSVAYAPLGGEAGEYVLDAWWRDESALRAHYGSAAYGRYVEI